MRVSLLPNPPTVPVVASSLIPLFTLGIPGNMAAALLIGAFVVHGMIPGPLMFEQNAQFIYAIYGSLIIANLFLLGVGRLGLRCSARWCRSPRSSCTRSLSSHA